MQVAGWLELLIAFEAGSTLVPPSVLRTWVVLLIHCSLEAQLHGPFPEGSKLKSKGRQATRPRDSSIVLTPEMRADTTNIKCARVEPQLGESRLPAYWGHGQPHGWVRVALQAKTSCPTIHLRAKRKAASLLCSFQRADQSF
jgi:hypothetical protein